MTGVWKINNISLFPYDKRPETPKKTLKNGNIE